MEKLKFTLKSEDETIINREESYYIKDNVIKFKIDSIIFEYDIDNDKLTKKDENILIMDFKNNNFIITLKENNLSFDIPISEVIIKKSKNNINIRYMIEENKMVNKCINIEY